MSYMYYREYFFSHLPPSQYNAGVASVPALCDHILRQVRQGRTLAENQTVRDV